MDLNSQQAERLAQSVSSNGKLSPPQSWRLAWKRKRWLQHLSGATLEPSTASRGVESWILSLAATRVSHSQAQESDLVNMILDIYGPRSVESLRRSNLASCSSRMSQVISHWDLPTFSEIYKKWVSDIRRDCLQRRKSARRIDASDSLFSAWPTVTAGCPEARVLTGEPRGSRKNPTIMDAVQNWPTPRVSCANGKWVAKNGKDYGHLETTAENWPTPCQTDHKGSTKLGQRRGQLSEATEVNFQISHQDQKTSTHGEESSNTMKNSRRRLNPIFTESMMGWPIGWTDFAPVEMALSLWSRRMRSRLFLLVLESK